MSRAENTYWVPSTDYSSRDTAANTRKAAEASAEMNERMGALVLAMEEQLRIARQSQADAERAERFTRRTAVLSLVVSIASLAAAVAAIVVAL